jgi:HEPN domain-containing protein
MQPESGSPAHWLRHAHSDLALARAQDQPGVLLEALCFHAQQAAEKALKAVLLRRGIAFPRTHDIEVLLNLLPAVVEVTADVEEARVLTQYAVVTRYPGTEEPVAEAEYQDAIRIADAVVQWAECVIGTS